MYGPHGVSSNHPLCSPHLRAQGSLVRHGVIAALALGACLLSGCCRRPAMVPKPPGPATAEFLDAADFSGTFDRRETDTAWGGESHYLGRIIFTNLDRALVESVLATGLTPDLHLAPNKSATPALHPVVLLVGRQTQTSFVLPPGWNVPVGTDYDELILLIPFVQKKGGNKWHNFAVHIFLDDFWAMWVGNTYYGLHKEIAQLLDLPPKKEVFRKIAQVFQAKFTTLGAWLDDTHAEMQLANYQHAKAILEFPVLGTITSLPGNPYVCSYFEFDHQNTRVRAIASRHEFVEEFEPGMAGWKAGSPFDSVPDGAFEIEGARWRMAFPPIRCKF